MTRIAAWIYCCDGPGCAAEVQVTVGDLIPPAEPDTNESSLPDGGEVRTASSANTCVRRVHGWRVGKDRHQLCPRCRAASAHRSWERRQHADMELTVNA